MNYTAFLALVVVFVLSYALRKASQPRSHQFPCPRSLPFLGNILGINLYRYTDTFEKWHKQLGDTIECFFMNFKYVDSIDHNVVTQVLHSSDRDDLYKYTLKDVMGSNSVILLDGPVWKKQRRLINSHYTSQALQHMMKTKPNFVAGPAQQLITRLSEVADTAKPLEMDLEFSRLSLAVIGNTVFSYDFDYSSSKIGDPDAPFLKELWDGMDEYNKRISEAILSPLLVFFFNSTKLKNPLRKYLNPYSIWRFSHTMRIIRSLVYGKINERLATQNLNEQGEKYDDSLGVMLSEVDEKSDSESPAAAFTYPEVVDNVVTLLLAGHETTAHALSFTCFEVAKHPHVEKRLIESLASLGNRPITHADLQADGALNYAGWVVMEALRIHPVAGSILRKWHTGQTLGDTVCESDFNVGITLPMLHKDERIWPNPEKFDPERFDESNEENKKRPVTAFLPFGGGPRTCIGKKLALLELKYMLATLYRHFVFRLIPDFKYDIEITVTMHETYVIRSFTQLTTHLGMACLC